MGNWEFGLTLAVVGMGGTMLALYFLSIVISLLKKIFPHDKEPKS